jgi:5'-deoxynucleotidase YfbR-like HD superfamily hydrolase
MKIEKNKIITFTGRQVDPFNLQPEDVNIVDIAHSLSHQNRYGGHTIVPYSVAQHCLRMEFAIEKECNHLEMQIDALMHDASEAYITDIPKPIKERIPMIEEIEANVLNVIYQKYEIKHFLYVQELDKDSVFQEIKTLKMLDPIKARANSGYYNPTAHKIRTAFLNRFNELTDGKFISETEPYLNLLVSR